MLKGIKFVHHHKKIVCFIHLTSENPCIMMHEQNQNVMNDLKLIKFQKVTDSERSKEIILFPRNYYIVIKEFWTHQIVYSNFSDLIKTPM